jgi:integrase
MRREWRPVFAQPSSFSVGQRFAERALSAAASILPRSALVPPERDGNVARLTVAQIVRTIWARLSWKGWSPTATLWGPGFVWLSRSVRTSVACHVRFQVSSRGAPPRAIQELAGHADLTMTQRYMHLSPAALDAAISLLERPSGEQSCGDILATGSPLQKRSMNPGV